MPVDTSQLLAVGTPVYTIYQHQGATDGNALVQPTVGRPCSSLLRIAGGADTVLHQQQQEVSLLQVFWCKAMMMRVLLPLLMLLPTVLSLLQVGRMQCALVMVIKLAG